MHTVVVVISVDVTVLLFLERLIMIQVSAAL